MLKLFDCTKDVVKRSIDNELTQSPFKFWKGWIGAVEKGSFYRVYHYAKFPKRTYNLHYYLRKIK